MSRAAAAVLAVILALAAVPPAAADLARCKEVRRQAARRGVQAPRKAAALVRRLQSPKPLQADLAYCRLATAGARAIDPLLAATAATAPYAGSAWIDPSSSVRAEPSQGLIALYLVEAILLGRGGERRLAPHLLPRLLHAEIIDEQILFAMTVPAYRAWWDANRRTPLDTLRAAGAHPLAGTALAWL